MLQPDSAALSAINEAMTKYQESTCIRFQERRNEEDYVKFFEGNG